MLAADPLAQFTRQLADLRAEQETALSRIQSGNFTRSETLTTQQQIVDSFRQRAAALLKLTAITVQREIASTQAEAQRLKWDQGEQMRQVLADKPAAVMVATGLQNITDEMDYVTAYENAPDDFARTVIGMVSLQRLAKDSPVAARLRALSGQDRIAALTARAEVLQGQRNALEQIKKEAEASPELDYFYAAMLRPARDAASPMSNGAAE